MTEHDFRFPRRPGADAGRGVFKSPSFAAHAQPRHLSSTTVRSGPGGLRAELQGLRLDLAASAASTAAATMAPAPATATPNPVRYDLLRASAFTPFQTTAAADSSQRPEDMRRQDPIAHQVWRFFAKTKQALPEQERMENLTWRMMHLTLRKRRQAEAAR